MTLKIKELPNSERPYEKLEMYGEKYLSNAELLAIIIKTGTKEDTAVVLAQKVLSLQNEEGNLKFLQNISIEELMKIKGIGKVKAIQLKAVCEFARRMSRPFNFSSITIRNTNDVAKILVDELKDEKREIVKVILLNSKNVIQKIIDITTGGVSTVSITPKEVLQEAVKMQVPKIILIHNHPSGDPTPSIEDLKTTKRIKEASEILGIQLIDHIIIGNNKYQSIFSKLKTDEKL
ncbi:MAG: DNA repair protein RadC [Clostridia bacterium]|nr:DNA repair protein RadC [Clostridia bacterium]